MASTYSIRFRIDLQAPGDNLNTWGTRCNTGVFQLLEDAMAKRVNFTLSGTKTLSTANGSTDEARCAFLDVTGGTGGTITAPALEKWYILRNGSSGSVILTTGSGLTVTAAVNEVLIAVGDGTNFRRVQSTDFAGQQITSVADPTTPQGVATKAYADNLAFTANAGILPGQGGNAGAFLGTNGTTAAWSLLTPANISTFSAPAATIWTGTSVLRAFTPGDTYTALAEVTIAYAGTITPDMSTFLNAVVTMTGNATLANPTNPKPGQTGRIRFIQDATGSRTLAVGANWKRVGGALPLSTTANAIDILEYDVITSSYILYNILRSPS